MKNENLKKLYKILKITTIPFYEYDDFSNMKEEVPERFLLVWDMNGEKLKEYSCYTLYYYTKDPSDIITNSFMIQMILEAGGFICDDLLEASTIDPKYIGTTIYTRIKNQI